MNESELMRRALALSRNARHGAPPNPWVGAVVVANDVVVGEGWTQPFGGPHAEVVALQAAGELARGSTMYVTLEPCAHHGKTPPCVDSIVAAGVARVVASILDPDPRVGGRGFEELERAGVLVEVGLESERTVDELIAYLSQRRTGRPWVRAKVAMTLDAKVADRDGGSQWITSIEARERGHLLRAQSQAVVVGSRTMEIDRPLLTARPGGVTAVTQPQRWVFAHRELSYCTPGVDVTSESPQAFLERMGRAGVLGVLIEGGPTLLASFVDLDLVDELYVYISPTVFGDDDAKPAFRLPTGRLLVDPLRFDLKETQAVGPDIEVRLWSERATTLASHLSVEVSYGSRQKSLGRSSAPESSGTMSRSESN